MTDISKAVSININVLDKIARHAFGEDITGVSTGPMASRIHLLDDSQLNQDIANAVLNNFGSLPISANKTMMVEGDTNPVITCSDALIASDSDVGYLVLLDGENFAHGITPVIAGVATLNLISPVAGIYEITIYRIGGNYASRSITITVSEV